MLESFHTNVSNAIILIIIIITIVTTLAVIIIIITIVNTVAVIITIVTTIAVINIPPTLMPHIRALIKLEGKAQEPVLPSLVLQGLNTYQVYYNSHIMLGSLEKSKLDQVYCA